VLRAGARASAALSSERELAAIAPDATAEQAHVRFAADAALEALVVLDDRGRVLGLLTRHRLLARLGHRFGFALYGQRPLLSIADRQCLALSEATPWRELAARAMARPAETRHDAILLHDADGRFARHLTIRALLETAAVADEQSAPLPDQPVVPRVVADETASVSGVTPSSSAW
jgi:hypothetical protein